VVARGQGYPRLYWDPPSEFETCPDWVPRKDSNSLPATEVEVNFRFAHQLLVMAMNEVQYAV
jgi:hypothetical protein